MQNRLANIFTLVLCLASLNQGHAVCRNAVLQLAHASPSAGIMELGERAELAQIWQEQYAGNPVRTGAHSLVTEQPFLSALKRPGSCVIKITGERQQRGFLSSLRKMGQSTYVEPSASYRRRRTFFSMLGYCALASGLGMMAWQTLDEAAYDFTSPLALAGLYAFFEVYGRIPTTAQRLQRLENQFQYREFFRDADDLFFRVKALSEEHAWGGVVNHFRESRGVWELMIVVVRPRSGLRGTETYLVLRRY